MESHTCASDYRFSLKTELKQDLPSNKADAIADNGIPLFIFPWKVDQWQ